MAAERVTLVLGGGGMKGLAHIGAWRAVLESGIRVTEIVGTSIGSLIGACIAGGHEHERLVSLARALLRTDIVLLNRWALLFNGIRQPSVFRDDTFRSYIASILPATTFAELKIPLAMNAVDLETGRQEWFGAGGLMDVPLADAVYASCALPVFYPPALIDGRYFVDGGVLDSLPVGRAVERGADRIIAIDVGVGAIGDSAGAVEKGMVAIHQRVMQIMGYARKRAHLDAHGSAQITYIRPHLDGYDTFDFTSTEYFLAEGYRAVHEALNGSSADPREAAG
ncbi:MAG: patatin-like phospholipase family protein [Longimicrobiales bacterium]